ncbi:MULTISPECIES: molybdopterin-binding protein [Bradyrhizobium]|jgi:molybdopterin molybdotransferase|uniref:molybdopterin-binding protein n=1 Tax=Bradyrhizobium TaxID=374 RepID=UPI000A19905A|nr:MULTISPECIES: molybdopterin-binding protein [Bradyrhizobium]MCK1269332.1 molybdopterin-binding protein [Bradyrhizobium sp. 84]MCK1353494.1 molybdopterin-binding protein [Bradyrhizobium sp. CW7]MCK1375039.1 molybdopterin-binding protein [Bradyrhizobium sp. 49]MCK1417914.1 molybdopterin-binding protein [Bradyrhizobium sp. CW4]MCK1426400.1 molybdopterin-binding protein [Bradyrhizobium sp. 87]
MTQRLPPSLTPLDAALAALLTGLDPLAPVELPLSEAAGCIAAGNPLLAARPSRDVAAADGWALCANDLVGASSYSPLPLPTAPAWADAGDAMPAGCDCVLDADAVEVSGPLAQVLAEGVPGQGVRRAGSDIDGRTPAAAEGYPVGPAALLLARAAGLDRLSVRRPRLRIVNVSGATLTMHLIADIARAAGLDVQTSEAGARDAGSIAETLGTPTCDLLLTIGGSGVGRKDAAVTALAQGGDVIAHGLALQPGRTAAIGRLGTIPVVGLPGSPDHALAVWLALVLPLVDLLSARQPRRQIVLPLARKIASSVGIAEMVLLAEEHHAWVPLAVGEWPLQAMARADAWLLVPAGHEGFAAGAPVDAYLMRE